MVRKSPILFKVIVTQKMSKINLPIPKRNVDRRIGKIYKGKIKKSYKDYIKEEEIKKLEREYPNNPLYQKDIDKIKSRM